MHHGETKRLYTHQRVAASRTLAGGDFPELLTPSRHRETSHSLNGHGAGPCSYRIGGRGEVDGRVGTKE
jgi:hypothetical protein